MESAQHTPSVIARLMGLDELPPQQPLQKKQRVLSDNYLRRVASIGVREKHQEHHLFKLSNEEQKECDIFLALEASKRAKLHATQFGKSLDYMSKIRGSGLESNNASAPISSIVVLKPNLVNGRYFPEDRKYRGILSHQKGNIFVELNKRKKLANSMGPFRSRSRFSKVITRKKEHDMDSISTDIPESEIIGGNIFSEDSALEVPSSPMLSNVKDQLFCSEGLHAAREAKKQILERWTSTKKYQQVELSSRTGFLCEESNVTKSDNKTRKHDLSNQVGPGSGSMDFGTRVALSSLDGWQDGSVKDFLRSRSLLANFSTVGSRNTRASDESLQKGMQVRALESVRLIQNKSRKQDSKQRGGFEYNLFSEAKCVSHKQLENELQEKDSCSHSSVVTESFGEDGRSLQYVLAAQDRHKNKVCGGDLFENNCVVPKSPEGGSLSSIVDVVNESPPNHEKHHLQLRDCNLSAKDENLSRFLNTSVQQDIFNTTPEEEESATSNCSVMDPESPLSLEESYQPSPISVLRPLDDEETLSSPNCFKSVSASLHGLQVQLELLKSESSETCSEGSGMAVSSDDDTKGEDNEHVMRSFQVEESRNFSYLVDVLTETDLLSRNMHTFDSLHSHDDQISSSVFENLEKKYGEQIAWKRSDRKLLFDRINLGLTEILQPFIGIPAWTKPVARRFNSSCDRGIEEELWLLLDSQEKDAKKDSEKFLGKDDKWLDLVEDVQVIAREIENSLIDELMADVVSM